MLSANPQTIPIPASAKSSWLSHLRWLILLIFPIGWEACHQFFSLDAALHQQFSQLTVLSCLTAGFVLYNLRDAVHREIHLWITFLLLLLGHYVKLYLVLHWKILGDGSIEAFPRASVGWVSDPALIVQSHWLSMYGLLGVAIAIGVIRQLRKGRSAQYQAYLSSIRAQTTHLRLKGVKPAYLMLTLCILIIVSFASIYLYADLQVNAYFSQTGFGRTVLKNNLAGILTYSTKILLPALFIVLIYIADTLKANLTFQLGVVSFLLYSVMLSFFITSKGPVLMAVLSLFIIWVFSNRLTPQRMVFLVLAFLSMPLLFGLVMNLRSLREFGEIGKLSNLELAYNMVQSGGELQRYQFTYISRIVGYNTLPEIINYNPAANFGEIYSFLFDNGFHIGEFFKTEVRQHSAAVGVGFAPGLVGCFYLLTGSGPAVTVLALVYTFFWDKIFTFTSNLAYITQPMAVAQICLISAANTTEGTLFKLPLQLLIVGVVIVSGEMAVRSFARGSAH